MNICFMCEVEKYPPEKLLDKDFLQERKNEFYPEEEFGDWCHLCINHCLQVDLYKRTQFLGDECP
jgi:hypothetical protein